MAKQRKTEAVEKPADDFPANMGPDLSHIALALRPLAVPIDTLVPDPENARLHPDDNLDAIQRSLEKFGQDQPLVVQRQGMIVRKGNGRLKAAQMLGWDYIAVVIVDEDNIDAAARAIADNRSAELAKWDERVLLKTMDAWRAAKPEARTTDLGFREDALAAMAAKLREAPTGSEGPIPVPDDLTRPEGRYKEQYGVIVVCEDAKQQEAVYEKLTREGLTCRVVVT